MNSTIDRVGWVAEPTGRGTLGLLVSCGTTIFLCTYSAVHPNLPRLGESPWRILLRKILYMVGCICVPEFFAAEAIWTLQTVREMRQKEKFNHPLSKRPWSLNQYYFLTMGGYVVQTRPGMRKRFGRNDLLRLIQEEVVEMPALEDGEIDDRSKANWFTKAVALMQVSWFLTQLLARAIQRLPVTTLELYTLGFVVCALFTYFCCWRRPFDVQQPVVLRARVTEYAWPRDIGRVSLFDYTDSNEKTITRSLCILVFITFAASHLIGWNFIFASVAEQWLWRVGSVCCALLPFAIILLALMPDTRYDDILLNAIVVLYVVARMALSVEVFIGLRSVPAGVYQTVRWSDYIPSFS